MRRALCEAAQAKRSEVEVKLLCESKCGINWYLCTHTGTGMRTLRCIFQYTYTYAHVHGNTHAVCDTTTGRFTGTVNVHCPHFINERCKMCLQTSNPSSMLIDE